jgi:acyl-CoA hydrolase
MNPNVTTTSQAVDFVFSKLGPEIRLATPLGLGKPNFFLNELYDRVKSDPSKNLKIFTALSLAPPSADSNELGRRFLKPFAERMWGKNYPVLQYSRDAEADRLPKNVKVHEFYFRAGSAMRSRHLQTAYQSINYTHVAEAVFEENVNLIAQLVASDPKGSGRYSLGSNPDVTLDLADLYRESTKPVVKIAVVHPDMPYVGDDAEVEADFFDVIVDDACASHELFALPRLPISSADHVIGFYASQLIKDEGTLQIGIGSLADAVVSSLLLRQNENASYLKLIEKACCSETLKRLRHSEPLVKGLYGLSEMVTDAYMHLHRAGLLKRAVYDESGEKRTYLHGAFFLGSKDFYSWLRSLDGADYTGLRMTRVSKVNDLYDPNEVHLRKQRINARFFNTCMQVTYLGGAASETLSSGDVVSGVGGQYNFVSMSHELKGARSILMLRSTRESSKGRQSNIVSRHGHLTIPRHLRDLVITEYGVADLRNKSDEECIRALIEIADSEFQSSLVTEARRAKKLSVDYEIPAHARNNTPQALERFISDGRRLGTFAPFALGSDFTPEEERLALALDELKSMKPLSLVRLALRGGNQATCGNELKRMNLDSPRTLKEKFYARLLAAALSK